jgi:hypothetical protein
LRSEKQEREARSEKLKMFAMLETVLNLLNL